MKEGLWFRHLISKTEQEPDMLNTASKPKQTKGVFTPLCSLKPRASFTSVHGELTSSKASEVMRKHLGQSSVTELELSSLFVLQCEQYAASCQRSLSTAG